MDETPSFTKRLGRFAQVTGTLGGAAIKTFGAKLTGNTDTIPQVITDALGKLKGPAMKVGQILAMVPGMVPDAMAESLMQLQSNAPSMGWPFVRRRMAVELGDDWQSQFRYFEREATAAASLGQVHKAQLHSGEWVACKLQYPNMVNLIQGDLDQLTVLLNIYERVANTLDTVHIQEELKARLMEELDYRREQQNMQRFHQIFEASGLNIRVPKSIPSHSTERLLTMEWQDGVGLMDVKSWPLELRKTIAANVFKAWYYPLYQHGVLHGDPHFGNYRIRSDGQIILLDFGCVREFSESFLDGVMQLYKALEHNDVEKAKTAYELWGFTHLTPALVEALNLWATFLYAPLMDDCVRPLVRSPEAGKVAARAVLDALKQSGKIRPPREFVFMDRAAVGVGSAMIHLDIELNWHQLFHSLLP